MGDGRVTRNHGDHGAGNNLEQNQICARNLESFAVLVSFEEMQVYYCPNGKLGAILLVK